MIDAVVIECKHSPEPSYVRGGFHEAVLYRHEYAASLKGSLKAILVASSEVVGPVRDDDAVIAVGWADWPPRQALASLVRRLVG